MRSYQETPVIPGVVMNRWNELFEVERELAVEDGSPEHAEVFIAAAKKILPGEFDELNRSMPGLSMQDEYESDGHHRLLAIANLSYYISSRIVQGWQFAPCVASN